MSSLKIYLLATVFTVAFICGWFAGLSLLKVSPPALKRPIASQPRMFILSNSVWGSNVVWLSEIITTPVERTAPVGTSYTFTSNGRRFAVITNTVEIGPSTRNMRNETTLTNALQSEWVRPPARTAKERIESLRIEGWKPADDLEAVFTSGKLVKVVFRDGTAVEGIRE